MKIEAHHRLSDIIDILKKQAGSGPVSVNVPSGSPLFKNLLDLKILLNQAERRGIKLKLKTEEERGQNLLGSLSETPPTKFGFTEGVDVASTQPRPQPLKILLTSRRLRKISLFLILISLAVVGVFVALFTIPRATITLKVSSEMLVQSFEMLASPSASRANKEQKILPAVLLSVEEKGEQKAETTGKKEVGEKARGEVTIHNWTDEERTFAEDTIITLLKIEGEKRRFLQDKEATVSAQTVSVSTTTEERTTTATPGKETVAVTAEKVGEEYNIKAGENFSLQGFSTDDFLAQNSNEFTGGKKEEILVATLEDRSRLSEKLKMELSQKAQGDLESRTVGDQKLHPEAIVIEVSQETFDKEVDEEAKELKLALTLKGRAVVYSKDQLRELVLSLLEENIPEGFDLADRNLTIEVAAAQTVELEEGIALQLLVKIKAFVSSKLDERRIKNDIAGRNIPLAKQYLEKLPNISSVGITTFPPLPGPFYRMPRLADRIDIKIEHE